jgi:peptidoglycan hydrolase CwlO-like protein
LCFASRMIIGMNNKNISKKEARKVLAERDPYVGIMLEEIQDTLKTVLDGQAMSDQGIDRLHGSVSRLEVTVERVDTRLSLVEMDMKDVKASLKQINTREESNASKIGVLENRVTTLEKKVA